MNPGEKVLWRGKPHKMRFLAPLLGVVPVGFGLVVGFFYLALVSWPNFGAVFVGLIGGGLLLTVLPTVAYKDWKDTEYIVTSERVFFDTTVGYAVINLSDVREVYIKIGILDRIFGTGSVCVAYRDFQPRSKYGGGKMTVIVMHKHPSFRSIKEINEVKSIIQKAGDHAHAR